MTIAVRLRVMTAGDVGEAADLCTQLGYPSTRDEVAERFGRLDPASERVIVAVDSDDTVIGWIHVAEIHSLLLSATGDIAGLVVDERHRGRRIGEALVAAAEAWAAERGLQRVDVRSNVIRTDAHRFYERLAYRRYKTSFVFRREIGLRQPAASGNGG